MRVAIHQPNYLPWLGYFRKIAEVDTFVFLDDVQFSKGSYTNRVKILSDVGARWLTVPVRAPLGVAICDVEIAKTGWLQSQLDILKGCYKGAPMFNEIHSEIAEEFVRTDQEKLASFNENLVIYISKKLGYGTNFIRSSQIETHSSSDDRLIEIMKQLTSSGTYLSGKGAQAYQDPQKFKAAGLGFELSRFKAETYRQFNSPGLFVQGLSIVDALFNLGWDDTAALIRRSGRADQ